ncbi:MAG: diguanylate cyclase, partial [Thermodesulfobacteriota bacterium]
LNRSLREQDLAGRFGGEEFLIILPETNIDGAVILAERIREEILNTEHRWGDPGIDSTHGH